MLLSKFEYHCIVISCNTILARKIRIETFEMYANTVIPPSLKLKGLLEIPIIDKVTALTTRAKIEIPMFPYYLLRNLVEILLKDRGSLCVYREFRYAKRHPTRVTRKRHRISKRRHLLRYLKGPINLHFWQIPLNLHKDRISAI